MLRAGLSRRTLWLGAAAAAAVAVHDPRDKLPIYPCPDPVIVLQETPSELERQIGIARRAVTNTYLATHSQVQDVVSRWIGIEQAVENRVKSIIAPDEPLTPGLLYVGVATLTGSIIARNRFLATRLLLPPTLFFLSLNHFLPKTSHNLSSYFGSLEDTYFPTLAQKHDTANAHTLMTWEMAKEATRDGREKAGEGVVALIGKLQDVTGLKLRESLGLGKGAAVNVEAKVREDVAVVEQKADAAIEAVGGKVEDMKAAAVEKADEVLATTEKQAEEVKRLV